MPAAAGCLDPSDRTKEDRGLSVRSPPSHRGPSRFTIIALLAAALLAARPRRPGPRPRGQGRDPRGCTVRCRAEAFLHREADAAAFRALCEGELQTAKKESIDARGEGQAYDREHAGSLHLLMLHADNAGSYSSLMESVHPDSPIGPPPRR